MRKNHFNNFNNVSSKQNNNEDEDSLNENLAQIPYIGQNNKIQPENNDNNLYENQKTEDNTYNNIILPNNNNNNGTNLFNNNNNHNSFLSGQNDDEIETRSNRSFCPINNKILDEISSYSSFNKDIYSPLPLNKDYFNNKKIKFDWKKLIEKNNYNFPFSKSSSIISEVNHQDKKFLYKKTKRRKGRLRKESKEKDDGTKRHTNKEIGNVTRKMLTSLKKKVHKFIKTFTRFKFYELTIKKFITGSHRKIRKFLKLTLFKLYHSHTLPKNFKGVKLLKLKDINNLKKRRKKKIEALKEYKKSIIKIIDDEKAQEIKPVTAILDLTLLDFLKIYLDYGYIDNIKKEIEIDENKYGLKFIDLQGFPTYYETKNEFSSNESEQNYYREHLKRLLTGKRDFSINH